MLNLPEPLHRVVYTVRMMSWLADPRTYLPVPPIRIDRPIFLIGTQGGGLTLLARMLQRHPDVVSGAGNARYWTSANEIQNIYGPRLPFDLTGLRYKAPPHPVLTAPRSWTFAARDLFATYRRTAQDATHAVRTQLQNIIRLSILRHAKNKHAARFLDKSQVYSVRVGMLQAALADCNPVFILVPRDPYVSVYRAAEGKAGDMARLKSVLSREERIDICAEHYANSMRAALEDSDTLGIAMPILPFEQLLKNPEESLRTVCAHAGLSYHADMLPHAHHKLPIGTRFLDRWYPIRADVNSAYEHKIDALTIERVNHHCGPDLIKRLGYETR